MLGGLSSILDGLILNYLPVINALYVYVSQHCLNDCDLLMKSSSVICFDASPLEIAIKNNRVILSITAADFTAEAGIALVFDSKRANFYWRE